MALAAFLPGVPRGPGPSGLQIAEQEPGPRERSLLESPHAGIQRPPQRRVPGARGHLLDFCRSTLDHAPGRVDVYWGTDGDTLTMGPTGLPNPWAGQARAGL